MEKYIGDLIIAISILVGLYIISYSKHPISIEFKIKDIILKISSKNRESK